MKKTVYVLGAGASKEAGLPIGFELKKAIAAELDIRFEHGIQQRTGSFLIVEALREHVQQNLHSRDINPHLRAGRRISEAMPQAISIDNFLDAHKGDEELEFCGKLAIVTSILAAERNSRLFVNPENYHASLDFEQLSNTWFNSFMQLITENCRLEDVEWRFKSIALIIFNYDRCFEHFAYNWLQTYYGISSGQAAKLVGLVEIHHPYGMVGHLPWYQVDNAIQYGAEPNRLQLIRLAAQIKTFTEGTDASSSKVVAIRTAMRRADRIVFLGFAFHRLNLELLWAGDGGDGETPGVKMYATAKGISPSDIEVIREALVNGHGRVVGMEIRNELTCSELFEAYRRTLSFV